MQWRNMGSKVGHLPPGGGPGGAELKYCDI